MLNRLFRTLFCTFFWIFSFFSPLALASTQTNLSTLAEQTQWKNTGRYDEVIRLCQEFPKAFPAKVKCTEFGRSPEGRPMFAFIASQGDDFTPESIHAKKKPVLLIQGGIHAGEIDGKDAGFQFLRDILAEPKLGSESKTFPKKFKDLLTKITIVFVPVFNVDGHERFGAHNRPNQVGPAEMGWRTTAQNLNLNRDYMKADAPEMAAMLKLLNLWDPVVYVDLHVTDGAEFQHDVAVIVEPGIPSQILETKLSNSHPKALYEVANEIRTQLAKELTKLGHLPLSYYPSFVNEDDPTSGIEVNLTAPRFSHGYWALHNRIGILVETHSWKDYKTRVKTTYDILVQLAQMTASSGQSWLKQTQSAESEIQNRAEKETVLSFETTKKSKVVNFLGYKYQREASRISGRLETSYDPSQLEVWKMPIFSELKPLLTVKAPQSGYFIPPAHAAWMGEKLKFHGIRFETVLETRPSVSLQTFRATSTELAKKTFEGHTGLKLKGAWSPETRQIPSGSLFVPIRQPLGLLVLHLLEPLSPDSFVAWGFFNAHFEQKEYMESYVAEKLGQEMLKTQPQVRAEFNLKLSEDPEFAKDPDKRLEFFYQKHPSWDERYRLYPIFKL